MCLKSLTLNMDKYGLSSCGSSVFWIQMCTKVLVINGDPIQVCSEWLLGFASNLSETLSLRACIQRPQQSGF